MPAAQGQASGRASLVQGQVVDAESGRPVGWAQVLAEEAGRSAVADAEGRFSLNRLPAAPYTVRAFRIGYEPLVERVAVPPGDTLALTLRLVPATVESEEVVVTARAEGGETQADRDVVLDGGELREQLGATIAHTLDGEPGLAMRSMGPAPARPVLRGLGGARLLVLEDGGPTGDLSHTSSDHAVAADPVTAERVEVLRGPAALRYGPNMLGGVVNVARGYVPTTRPRGVQGTASVQGASVSRGGAGALSLAAPLGGFALQADGSLRGAGDVHTPAGVLENTALATSSASLGASRVASWGLAGAGASVYRSDYGIPGGFVGAHPSGVSIEMQREHAEARAAYLPASGPVRRWEAEGRYTRYQHQEYESSGALGIEFGVVSQHAAIVAETGALGPFQEGSVGLTGRWRDYAAAGFAFTPPTTEGTLAGFLYQKARTGDFVLEGGLRLDYRRVTPSRQDTSRLIGVRRARRFAGLSGAAGARWEATGALALGARLMRSLRVPGIEELYSEGPHLAAYSFEVGNPTLDMERGWGAELFARYDRAGVEARGALFYNRIAEYIFPQNTGRPSRVQLPIYQYVGTTARLVGGEGEVAWRLGEHFELEGTASYVRGTRLEAGQPLPQIPPLRGRAGLRYRRGALALGAGVRAAAAQTRTGDFEEPTDGYAVADLSAQYHFTTGRWLHTLDLGLQNLLDTTYRDHLSRVRVIMPEPGRGLRLLYKVHF